MSDPVLTEAAAAEDSARIKVNPPVFFVSAGLILAFALFGAFLPQQAGLVFNQVQAMIVRDFGWLYIASVAGFLVFVIYLMLSRHGDVKLGPDESEPDYSYVSWFAMLFSAGMGIGLVFFGVAEPIQHYASPPVGEGGTPEAARQAMTLTFFHWGLHAWAIYIVVGLSLAYFSFRRGLPLTIRSALYPLIGQRIFGPIGHAIDIFAVLGTMFGVATSLGLGVLQVNAGFSYLFGAPVNTSVQLMLIASITLLATLSVFLGLDRGVKRLSEINMALAGLLLVFVLIVGPTMAIFTGFFHNLYEYARYLHELSNPFGRMDDNFRQGWTAFYWAWWISWSPFVGMFIARVSRGRSVREFLTCVLLIPSVVSVFWMTVFGGTAIDQLVNDGYQLVADAPLELKLFAMLEGLPLQQITSFIAIVLVIVFFVTSSDSGSLVIDTITAGGKIDAPVPQRIFWASFEGLVAIALLLGGGLGALQAMAVSTGFPFTIILLLACYCIVKGLHSEPR